MIRSHAGTIARADGTAYAALRSAVAKSLGLGRKQADAATGPEPEPVAREARSPGRRPAGGCRRRPPEQADTQICPALAPLWKWLTGGGASSAPQSPGTPSAQATGAVALLADDEQAAKISFSLYRKNSTVDLRYEDLEKGHLYDRMSIGPRSGHSHHGPARALPSSTTETADVVGYSRFVEQDQAGARRQDRHPARCRPHLGSHGLACAALRMHTGRFINEACCNGGMTMPRLDGRVLALGFSVAIGAGMPAWAHGSTERISLGLDGAQGDGPSFEPAISADGRFVAFQSEATNLVPGDSNSAPDVFVRDRKTGRTSRVSVRPNGAQGNGPSAVPAISADGRFVAFYSDATNLVPSDTNDQGDVFVHDRKAGTTRRVSVGPRGAQGDASSSDTSDLGGRALRRLLVVGNQPGAR